MDVMDGGLWKMLPEEVLEQVLSFLPVLVLYKFRTVCKTWYSLIITNSSFATLCVQNAKQDATFFMVWPLMSHPKLFTSRLKFLNPSVRQWYTIERHNLDANLWHGPFAVNGGLLCKCSGRTIQVFNILVPTLIKQVQIPPCSRDNLGVFSPKYDVFGMAVDTSKKNYKVFLGRIDSAFSVLNGPLVINIYDSSTNSWDILSFGIDLFILHKVIFEGTLYMLAGTADESPHWSKVSLWNVNHENGGCVNRIAEIEDISWDSYLCATHKGLFLIRLWEYIDDGGSSGDDFHLIPNSGGPGSSSTSTFFMCEELLTSSRKRPGAELRWSVAHLQQLFGVQNVDVYEFICDISMFGHGISIIVILRSTGKLVRFNLVTYAWDELPSLPRGVHNHGLTLKQQDMNYIPPRKGHGSWLEGQEMNLILPGFQWL